MKRAMFMTVLLSTLLLSVAGCAENTESQGNQSLDSDDKSWERHGERMDEKGDKADSDGDSNGGPYGGRDGGRGGQGGGMSNQSSEPDEELQAILDEVQDKYQLLTFTDPDTGYEMQYELFVPEKYDAAESYPMIMFIPDSRAAGREAEISLTIGWGGVIWATTGEQAKHPSFVLIPVFTETIVDDNFNTSPQIEVAVNLIHDLCDTYSIDTDRLYATGQSMGGMTSFHLNAAYPDLFAASLFVGSQWNNEILNVLEEDKFFYIVSAGDDKASTGQTGLMAVFDADGVPYTHEEWSAQEDQNTQNAFVESMIAKGLNANFVTFTKGTTVEGGASGSEHLTSFDYAYKLETVRDWLFAQSK
ncbi:MAG: pyrroline-5-carboxylate reductase [Lachnospiraceae bacterium]|nr:pyrroline-5-carboxylate reductase [Lachnospiraceae bacterium]